MFRQKGEELLDQFYRQPRKKSTEEEKLKVIQLVAQLILEDISNSKCKVDDVYPAGSTVDIDFVLEYLPCTLMLFLTSLFEKKKDSLKVATIGQSIMQCTRPLSLMMPFSFFLGVHLHKYGSRYLI